MIPANINEILKFLKEHDLDAKLQEETSQVYVLFKYLEQEFALFIRLYENEEMLQLLTFFPVQIPKERYDVMARMLNLLNKEIDLPGFGMDEAIGIAFHRIMLPLFKEKQIDNEALESYLRAIPKICTQFFPIIAGTAGTNLSFDALMKKAQDTIAP